jgi:predicted PurR-regulated permease PerM
VNGLVPAAATDGMVLGIGYVLFGVPHPLLFAVLTTAFAMVPFGAWIALTAAVLTLLTSGGTLWGCVGLFGFRACVLLIVDNFIQPAPIGGTARLPFLLALIGTLGGLAIARIGRRLPGPGRYGRACYRAREWVGMRVRADMADMRAID